MSHSTNPPAARDFVPPTVEALDEKLPAYEVLGVLGSGGMGAVYKARQISLDRLVAIKILPNIDDDGDLRFAERFQREARAMAKLSHPNILSVFDFGSTDDEQLFFVMELFIANMAEVPSDLPPAIDIRAGFKVSAARLRDGTWRAWGNNDKGIVDKINSLGGDVFDLSAADQYVLWLR